MRESRTGKEGFSLIEMIIAIAIVGIVISAVLVLLSYATGMMRRTNNTVSLQNQSKDAMLHITTHLQESSEASWNATDHVLTMAKIEKNDDGSPKTITGCFYWVDSAVVAAGDGGSTDADEADKGKGGRMFYAEYKYQQFESDGVTLKSGFSPVSDYFASDGSVDFAKVTLTDAMKTAAEADASHTFIRNVTGFNCNIVQKIEAASGVAVSTISGKTVTVQLALVNDMGDATFNNVKDIYMRNQ